MGGIEGAEGVRGSEGIGIQEAQGVSEGAGVQEGVGGIRIFCKNLLPVTSRCMFLHQSEVCTYINLLHPYNPSSFFLMSIYIMGILYGWK